jgi:hypothetical protein
MRSTITRMLGKARNYDKQPVWFIATSEFINSNSFFLSRSFRFIFVTVAKNTSIDVRSYFGPRAVQGRGRDMLL